MSGLKNRRIKIFWIILFVLLAGILYWAADRYLIEHVEIDNVNPTHSGTQSNPTENNDQGLQTEVFLDDWHYQSGDTSITIKKIESGAGDDQITYFVADIKLSVTDDLLSAFAKNQFGRNIIENTSEIAQDNNAVFAVNGDYYGFRSNGILIRNGVIYRDEPARTGMAFYKNGSVKIYDETKTNAQKLLDEGVWHTLSFAPALIENGIVPSNLSEIEVDTNFGNHSIQGAHPRTGIGLIDNNHYVVIVVDGRYKGYSKGVTLPEFAQIFIDLGCTNAYNMDGGGSSTMFFNGRVVNNPLGKGKERGVSDILYIPQ